MPVANPVADGLAGGLAALGEQGNVAGRVEEQLRRYLALLPKCLSLIHIPDPTGPY